MAYVKPRGKVILDEIQTNTSKENNRTGKSSTSHYLPLYYRSIFLSPISFQQNVGSLSVEANTVFTWFIPSAGLNLVHDRDLVNIY